MIITICNTTEFDKDFDEFVNNPEIKYAGGSKISNNDLAFIELLSYAVPTKLKLIPFKDLALAKEDTIVIQKVFSEEILRLLSSRKPIKEGTNKLAFLGNTYLIDVRPSSINYQDYTVMNYYRAYKICEECLQENKPMFLSIYEDEE